MMLPPGFSAVFMVGMVVLVGGELTTVDDSNWWETCKGPVCTVAENQAEGLARLRVLSNYVKETMYLMETVVASLDNEMLEVGRELRNVVGRRCHARGHTALNALVTHVNQTETDNEMLEVTSDNDDSWTSGSDRTESTSVWSSDVDLVSGSSSSSHSTSQRPSSTSHGTYHGTSQRPSSTLHGTHQQTTSSTSSTWRGTSQYPSSTWQSTSQHHGSDPQISSTSSSSSSRSSSTTSHSNGKTLHRRPSSTLKKYEAVPTEQFEDVYVAPAPVETIDRQGGTGEGRHGQGYGPGQGRGGGRGRGRGHGSSRGHGRGRSQGGLLSLALGTLQCLGVPIGSPHYVPGLDSWCATNCAAGNCPATHCICS